MKNLENYVNRLLKEKGIISIQDLTIKRFSEEFNVKVVYGEYETCMLNDGKRYMIVIDSRIDEHEQYYQFLHELSHHILEHLNFIQLTKSQWKFNELKANHLIPLLAMPTFLFDDEYQTIGELSEYFNAPYNLVIKRMEKITGRHLT